eukprot:TRINITY_DN1679_c0_g1_i6.p1 TRINITY_DN1679_c0_g1~~TRINITY_DN1679_c0_g1_i6.p1  ORF type:complete len:314 (-),score=20.20 TRINITY_DN1679_c0_g1_i6:277-1218(-)
MDIVPMQSFELSQILKEAGVKEDKNTVIRMLISQRGIGELLGERGQNLKTIQEQNQCHIRFSDSNDRYPGNKRRVMEVKGNSLHLFQGLRHVFPILHQVQQFDKQQSRDSGTSNKFGNEFFVMVIFNVELAGRIIGKDGSTLNSIQEKTNTTIQGEQGDNVVPGCLNRIFWVRGGTDNVLHALIEIIALVQETESYRIFASSDILEYTELGWFPNFLQQVRRQEFFKSEELELKLVIDKKYLNKIEKQLQEISKQCQCDVTTESKENTALVIVKGAFLNSIRAKALVALQIKEARIKSGDIKASAGLRRAKRV